MSKKRRRFGSEFKAKVAREAIEGRQTISEIASKYEVHPQQVQDWKRQALSRMSELFEQGSKSPEPDPTEDIKELRAKIGQLAMENDFLARGLGLVTEPKKGK